MSSTRELQQLTRAIEGKNFLVVGDLYLDSYIFGEPARVSREAPIMVLEELRREYRPGGGTAPALALAKLGATVWQTGVVGDDSDAAILRELLERQGVSVDGIQVDPDRPTTTKLRLVAEGSFNVFPQQVARVDRQDRSPIAAATAERIAAFVSEYAPHVDAILLSDYRSGVIQAPVIDAALSSGTLTTVDSQGALHDFRGLGLVKCNQAEAEAYLQTPITNSHTRKQALCELREQLDCDRLVVTLGPGGAALVLPDQYVEMPPRTRRQVFDVTGAGDTVIALLTGVLAAGGSPADAVHLSQLAAGIVLSKWGNAQATRDEILAIIDETESFPEG